MRPSALRLFVERELRRAARQKRTWIGRTLVTSFVLLLLLAVITMSGYQGNASPRMRAKLGQLLASFTAGFSWMYLALSLPPAIASGVQEESERARGDLLTLTGIGDIGAGVAGARVALGLVTLIALVPGFALAAGLGGIDVVNDPIAVGLHLGCAVLEIGFLTAWVAGAGRESMPVALLVWFWIALVSLIAPVFLFRGPADLMALVSAPIGLLSMYSTVGLGTSSVRLDLFIPLVHGPTILLLALAPRMGAGVPVLLSIPMAVVGYVAFVVFGPAGGLPSMFAGAMLLGAGHLGFGAIAGWGLRWWSGRSEGEAAVAPDRVAPKAAKRWTDHIWDDPVAWRETATNAYGVVNRIIGRTYIGSGLIAILLLLGSWLAGPESMSTVFFGVGILGLTVALAVTVLAGAASILEERRSQALELLLISNLGPGGVLKGKERAALLLAGPGAAVALIGLPAWFGVGRISWDFALAPVLVTFAMWLPAVLVGLGALVRWVSLLAPTATVGWQRVAALVMVLVLTPGIIGATRPSRGYGSRGWLMTDIAELLIPWRADVDSGVRIASTAIWIVIAVVAGTRARWRLEAGTWRR